MKKVTAVLVGAGNRGADIYAEYALAHPDEFQVTAVAEPDPGRRGKAASRHRIPPERQFKDYRDLFDGPRLADCAMICTQDRMHCEPVLQALAKGYHVLCEKPMSPIKEELIAMGKAAEESGRILSVCHVLRYSSFFTKIKELLDRGTVGKLIAIQHMESVGHWHMAHSFVRGNWRDKEETSPMILQKCCHDMDILLWLADSKCSRLCSFGELSYFKEENAPEGAPAYCMDGCEYREECPYYAPRLYLEHYNPAARALASAVTLDTSPEGILQALRKGPYGRCVFHCDNNVVDHQVVDMVFENGVTASFTMCAFTQECERVITLMGTKGQIKGNMETGEISVYDFAAGTQDNILLNTPAEGHSGSDTAMMKDFVRLIASEGKAVSRTSASLSVQSHLMALAAEESRVSGQIIRF